ncbi:MAG: 50S ribosomal protein L11 methyltransferase [Prevotellaceae bacterium]|jgi:ribosomal protein L11 methyltransferase|nr:50S ribosomal protein L11 methyltransferase [Prevotellaceae bacterium]
MQYYELTIPLQFISSEEQKDIIIATLAEVGFESFSDSENGNLCAYIQQKMYNEQAVKAALGELQIAQYEVNLIPDQNWNTLWESNFEPIVVDEQLTIRAPFHNNLPKTEMEIVMEPKMAFGTGHHETTYLCTQYLLNADVKNKEVLDMGCGTGVLAMVAAMRGAAHADAIDIDEWSYQSTIENAERNGVADKITALCGDAALIPQGKYHLVLANINRNILLQDMPRYAAALKPCGTLVVSGIYTTDVETVTECAIKNGFKFVEQKERNGWAVVKFEKLT